MFSNVSGNPATELRAGRRLRHTTDVFCHELHAIASVRAEETQLSTTLARTTVDDGDEVIGDDDAVLALSLRAFGDEGMFDYFHGNCGYWSYGTYKPYWVHGRIQIIR